MVRKGSTIHQTEREWPRWVVGLTGGVGSGKSTVVGWLLRRGVAVADADEIVRSALNAGGAAFRRVRRLAGPHGLQPDGKIDRAALARRVFTDVRFRRKLEAIVHPLVRREFQRRLRNHRRGLFVLDVPLLFETGMDRLVDRTVVVWSPQRLCLARLAASGRLTRAQARKRMAAQMPLREKGRRAHFRLDNRGSLKELRRRVDHLFGKTPGVGPLPTIYKNVTNS